MAKLLLQETDYCPLVKGSESGVLEIIGKSTMEDPLLFYAPVHKWMQDSIVSEIEIVTVVMDLIYINSSSTKQLLRLLLSMDESDKGCKVKWVYPVDNDFLKERGEEFAVMLDCPFEYLEKGA